MSTRTSGDIGTVTKVSLPYSQETLFAADFSRRAVRFGYSAPLSERGA